MSSPLARKTLSPSAKNALQEHYQKLAKKLGRPISLPIYNSKRCGGDDHIPLWISTVTLYDGKTYKGGVLSSRKKAEISSARVALVSLNEAKLRKNKIKVVLDKVESPNIKTELFLSNVNDRYLVLIDSENQPSAVRHFIENYKKSDVDLIAFLSVGHVLKYKINTDILKKCGKGEDPRIKVVEIPSTRKNSADVGLTIYLTNFLLSQKNPYKKIILVSNDKFVAALAEIINNSSKMGIDLGSDIGMVSTRTMTECMDILTNKDT